MIAKPTSPPQIAILGWGSLIWDKDHTFNKQHTQWLEDGPVLPLEFSRISKTRDNALTLVIDHDNGHDCTVQYAMSKRRNPEDAVADLRTRESTIIKNIGIYYPNSHNPSVSDLPATIPAWATAKHLDAVVWTNLLSNFREKTKNAFSIEAAIRHIQGLSPAGKYKAAEYVWRAPEYVQTPLRTALQEIPWFTPHASI